MTMNTKNGGLETGSVCSRNSEIDKLRQKAKSTRSSGSVSSHSTSLSGLSSISSFPVYCHNSNIKASQLRTMLKDKLKSGYEEVLKAFRSFDRNNTGKILPLQLKQVISTFCFPITAEQFSEMRRKLSTDNYGKVDYREFMKQFAGVESDIKFISSDCVIRSLPTQEVELQIKYKISKNLKNVIKAMWLYDYNKDGFIQKDEMRNVLENYCFRMSDEIYNRFWHCYDPQSLGIVCYKDFLVKLGINVDRYQQFMPRDTVAKALSWTDPLMEKYVINHRLEQMQRRAAKQGSDDPAIQGLLLEDVITVFRQKVQKCSPILHRAFRMLDPALSGVMSAEDFHRVLTHFVMPMSSALFSQIMKQLNLHCEPGKKINWLDFMRRYGEQISKLNENQQPYFRNLERCPPEHTVVSRLKTQGINPEVCLKKVFTKLDNSGKRLVTRAELRRAIDQAIVFPLTNGEFKELMISLDPEHTNIIDCQDFLTLFEDVPKEIKEDSFSNQLQRKMKNNNNNGLTFHHLHGKKLTARIKKYVNKNMTNIEKALCTCDGEGAGLISPAQLRQVLNNFSFTLTDEQFQEILSDFSVFRDRMNYHDFLDCYRKKPNEDTEKWIHAVNKLTPYKNTEICPLSPTEIEEHIREVVISNKDALLQDFKTLDYCNVGITQKNDVRKLLNKYVLRMNDTQFESIWQNFPRNEYDHLRYRDFLQEYSNVKLPQKPASSTCSEASQHSSKLSLPSHNSHSPKVNRLSQRPRTASSVISGHISPSSTLSGSHSRSRPKSATPSSRQLLSHNSLSRCSSLSSLSAKSKASVKDICIEGRSIDNGIPAPKVANWTLPPNENKISELVTGNKDCEQFQNCENLNTNKHVSSLKDGCIKNERNHTSNCNDHDNMRFAIQRKWKDIMKRCQQIDTKKEGYLMGEQLKAALNRCGITFNADTIKILESVYGVEHGKQVNYWSFLCKFALQIGKRNENSTMIKLQQAKDSAILGTESPFLYQILMIMKDKVEQNWRDIRQRLRQIDSKLSGTVEFSDFRKTLNFHSIHLSEEEVFQLLEYFDPNLTGKICYNDFLRVFGKSV